MTTIAAETAHKPTHRDDSAPPQISEIIVLEGAESARLLGLKAGRQPFAPHIRCWWPGLGIRELAGSPFQRVTISKYVRDRTTEGSLRAILRSRQTVWGDQAIWVEL